jgi:hypothetical protein
MTGHLGHAGEHAAHKLMTTASPTKALMVAGADLAPHAAHKIMATQTGKRMARGASRAQGKVQEFLQHARQAVAPGPAAVPALA